MGDRDYVGGTEHVAMWDAIEAVVVASGGLRHTCGSSLVAGWWGRAWSLQEVRDMLGHRNIATTERYAHLAPSVIELAARATEIVPASSQELAALAAETCVISMAPPARFERTTFGLGSQSETVRDRALGLDLGPIVGRARAALTAIATGDPHGIRRAIEVLGEIARAATQDLLEKAVS